MRHIYSYVIKSISVTKEKIKTLEKKTEIPFRKNVALAQDHCFLKSRRTIQATKKLDCPVILTVKKIFPFPKFEINEKNELLA